MDLTPILHKKLVLFPPGFREDFSSSIRNCFLLLLVFLSLLPSLGCGPKLSAEGIPLPDQMYGRRGLSEGKLMKPRAMVMDKNDNNYIVDMTGRVSVFSRDGEFLRFWNTPIIKQGKPTGMGIDRDGNILVADTHYFRILFYTKDGKLLEEKTIGGVNGQGPGEFGWVTDVVQDTKGNFFISEYGEFDRIQKYTADGKFICQFGKEGSGPLEFNRPQSMVIDAQDRIFVADACNHRVQVIECPEKEPKLLWEFGKFGKAPGEFQYPYGISMDRKGNLLISEFENHRVQRVTTNGKPLASWGSVGSKPGQLNFPWAALEDSRGTIHILDCQNHRVQKARF